MLASHLMHRPHPQTKYNWHTYVCLPQCIMQLVYYGLLYAGSPLSSHSKIPQLFLEPLFKCWPPCVLQTKLVLPHGWKPPYYCNSESSYLFHSQLFTIIWTKQHSLSKTIGYKYIFSFKFPDISWSFLTPWLFQFYRTSGELATLFILCTISNLK